MLGARGRPGAGRPRPGGLEARRRRRARSVRGGPAAGRGRGRRRGRRPGAQHPRACSARARALRAQPGAVRAASPIPSIRIAALNNLARARAAEGELEPAAELVREALELVAAQGDRHREAALRNNLADTLHRAGRDDEAMEELKRAVAIFAEVGGHEDEPSRACGGSWNGDSISLRGIRSEPTGRLRSGAWTSAGMRSALRMSSGAELHLRHDNNPEAVRLTGVAMHGDIVRDSPSGRR